MTWVVVARLKELDFQVKHEGDLYPYVFVRPRTAEDLLEWAMRWDEARMIADVLCQKMNVLELVLEDARQTRKNEEDV